MKSVKALIILLLGLLSLSVSRPAWADAIAPPPEPPDITWTYANESGPDFWGDLDAGFATCASGQSQSPIDLIGAEGADLLNPEFHYEPVPLNLLNNGHTVQMPYAPGSYLTLEGQQYNLLQFHFHSPSEHAIAGQSEAVELHLVHQNERGDIAVVAVFLHPETESNPREISSKAQAYSDLSQNLPTNAGDKIRTGKTINAQTLLPAQTTTYRYSGSLTTPPCSESVTWLVMSEPVALPSSQLAQYEKRLNHNNRPLQRLNQRAIQMDVSP